jgi:6-pyruvoyltetrahydropterin/6-carboxytetrahydropterin synthase
LKGGVGKSAMLLDFKDIKEVLSPLLKAWDHATLVAENDHELLRAMKLLQTKYYLLPFDSTSENLCLYVAEYLGQHAIGILKAQGVQELEIKLQETETCFATYEVSLEQLEARSKKVVSTILS